MPSSQHPAWLSQAQLEHDLAIRDLSDPAAGPHALQQLVALAASTLASSWAMDPATQIRWCCGPRVVPVADNYDRLRYAPGDVTREARYTRYVSAQTVLRSHSTALVPAALRDLARDGAAPDVLLVCPAMVYRRDAIDWQHTGTPHQLDLWRVSRGRLAAADLEHMIAAVTEALLPGLAVRQEARLHPYTTDGRQIDVRSDRDWVEIGECGLAHAGVLADAGLAGRTGLALGVGLDRLLMLRKGVPDIRLLRSENPRVAGQMQDLAPYRPVSRQPAVRRDLSVAVPAGEDAETIGDRVRLALGADADAVEDVRVLTAAGYGELPAAAIERIGMQPGQRNLLVRVVLRRLDRALTDAEANSLRDRVYAAIHQGSRAQWAATRR